MKFLMLAAVSALSAMSMGAAPPVESRAGYPEVIVKTLPETVAVLPLALSSATVVTTPALGAPSTATDAACAWYDLICKLCQPRYLDCDGAATAPYLQKLTEVVEVALTEVALTASPFENLGQRAVAAATGEVKSVFTFEGMPQPDCMGDCPPLVCPSWWPGWLCNILS
jgi:hypothetical protein